MFILAFKTGHDPAACLLEDGRIVAAAEEERFVRVKHAADFFPEYAIRFCLKERGLSLDQVDHIVFAREKNLKTFLKVFFYFVFRFPRNGTEFRYALSLLKVQVRGIIGAGLGKAPYQQIFRIVGGKKRGIYSFDHHQCHASSAYYGSGLDEAAVLCMDGKGECTSISMWHGKHGKILEKKRYGIFESLGYLYGSLTHYLGFWINDGEYKLMGLAPYGKPNFPMDDVFRVGDKGVHPHTNRVLRFAQKFFGTRYDVGVHINTRYSLYPFSLSNLKNRFPNISNDYNEASPPQPNTDISATLQDRLEKAGIYYVKEAVRRAGVNTLCLAGGVALNVKMNKSIWESGLLKNMWVQPAAGDMGNVLGAAWLLYYQKTGKRPEPMQHLYLGAQYSDEEIEKALQTSGLKYEKKEDIAKEVAELLSQGKIVALVQGRFEFGPRALGARSVLADPREARMKDVINAKVKFREPFRPFCPSILEGHAQNILEHYLSSPFMVMSFSVTPEWREKLAAVVHVDGTVRPQEVSEKTNPVYAKMIKYFYEKTGVPVVLNTSLNVKGEPIVNTPEQAVNFFKKTDVDYLAIGSYLAKK